MLLLHFSCLHRKTHGMVLDGGRAYGDGPKWDQLGKGRVKRLDLKIKKRRGDIK